MIQKIGFGSGFNHIGFGESSPKLSADFTTGTYKASGAAKTFADLFTFSRAGKAWLVNETGLQEYAVDTPRFDDGILIEQSATNMVVNSIDGYAYAILDAYESGMVTRKGNQGFVFSNKSVVGLGSRTQDSAIVNQFVTFSVYTTNTNVAANEYGGRNTVAAHYNGNTAVGNNVVMTSLQDGRYISTRKSSGYYHTYFYPTSDTSANATYMGTGAELSGVRYSQIEKGVVSSYIKTEATPVTRPADFLLNKITGTTVTGDWDSTLNLSIVNGNLVHSGYGRIRSLEIN